MNTREEPVLSVMTDTVHTDVCTGLEQRVTRDGYELLRQRFPDGTRTIKYLKNEATGRIPVQYIFSAFNQVRDRVWHYEVEQGAWYEEDDLLKVKPWRGSFSFDADGNFVMSDVRVCRTLYRDGSESRVRVDQRGRRAVIRTDSYGIPVEVSYDDHTYLSIDGDEWSNSQVQQAGNIRRKFELELEGDFIISGPPGRTEVRHDDGSTTVTCGSIRYMHRDGLFKVFERGSFKGEYVEVSDIAELPRSTGMLKGRVINESSRPVLVGARDSDNTLRIYAVASRSATLDSANVLFVVDDERYQVRMIDGRVLAPLNLPREASIFKLGYQTLKVTNDSWGFVLLGWPFAGSEILGKLDARGAQLALRRSSRTRLL